jgi:hypothetical protein
MLIVMATACFRISCECMTTFSYHRPRARDVSEVICSVENVACSTAQPTGSTRRDTLVKTKGVIPCPWASETATVKGSGRTCIHDSVVPDPDGGPFVDFACLDPSQGEPSPHKQDSRHVTPSKPRNRRSVPLTVCPLSPPPMDLRSFKCGICPRRGRSLAMLMALSASGVLVRVPEFREGSDVNHVPLGRIQGERPERLAAPTIDSSLPLV